jgi:hypothetical protein
MGIPLGFVYFLHQVPAFDGGQLPIALSITLRDISCRFISFGLFAKGQGWVKNSICKINLRILANLSLQGSNITP